VRAFDGGEQVGCSVRVCDKGQQVGCNVRACDGCQCDRRGRGQDRA